MLLAPGPLLRLAAWNRFKSFCKSDLILPLVFVLSQYKIWLGIQTFTHDTGDGLAAFKFSGFLPQYWNWFENTGQPYLFDVGAYRYSDPLMWPLLLLVKLLPISILAQFNLYILVQIALIALGCIEVLKYWGVKKFERNVASLIILFGSFSAVQFRSIGMMDLLFCFVFFSLAFLFWIERRKLYFLLIATAVLLHSALSYHILYFVPLEILFLGLCFWCTCEKKEKLTWLRSQWRSLSMMVVLVVFALCAEYVVVKDPLLLPTLRNIRYNKEVNSSGTVISPSLSFGQSILKGESLRGSSKDCNSILPCREYEYRFLDSFVFIQSYYSLTGFISVLALLAIAWGVLKARSRRLTAALLFTGVNFIWSLGSYTPFWGLTQEIFPFLSFVRHTVFFVPLFCLGLVACFSFIYPYLEKILLRREGILLLPGYLALIGLSIPNSIFERSDWRLFLILFAILLGVLLLKKQRRAVVFLCIALECLIFQRVVAESFKDFTTPKQLAEIERKLPSRIRERELRVLNDFGVPRSSASTAYGIPSALEPIHRPTMDQEELEKRFNNILFFGHFTPFMLKPYVEARLKFGEDSIGFRKVFGVTPYSVVQVFDRSLEESRFDSLDLEIRGEVLYVEGSHSSPKLIYLSLPHEGIAKIRINGRETPFKKARDFGVEVGVPSGPVRLELTTERRIKRQFYLFYYGAYLGLLGWALVGVLSFYRRKTPFELNPYFRWHHGKTFFKLPRFRRA